ncbi:MAG: class I SAM-dependent methyltransferase [Myxococcota bacterium]|nr:class I SAM-dependent methyltransferase [Myxococcota bacterium]
MKKHHFDLAAGTSDFYVDTTYYDHEFKARMADVCWYTHAYLQAQGPVLELAVGTGRIALKAVRQGAEVVGLDLSASMLERAAVHRNALPRTKQSKLHLARADMRAFELGRRFNLITCPFNAFMHLYTRGDVEACLQCVRRHLEPGGRFILDVLMADFDYLLRSPFKRIPGIKFLHPTYDVEYTYSEQTAYDPLTQLNQMEFHYDRCGEGDGPPHICIQLSHRYFYPEELRALLHYNGFEIVEEFGDFEGAPLEAESDSFVVVCTASASSQHG